MGAVSSSLVPQTPLGDMGLGGIAGSPRLFLTAWIESLGRSPFVAVMSSGFTATPIVVISNKKLRW